MELPWSSGMMLLPENVASSVVCAKNVNAQVQQVIFVSNKM